MPSLGTSDPLAGRVSTKSCDNLPVCALLCGHHAGSLGNVLILFCAGNLHTKDNLEHCLSTQASGEKRQKLDAERQSARLEISDPGLGKQLRPVSSVPLFGFGEGQQDRAAVLVGTFRQGTVQSGARYLVIPHLAEAPNPIRIDGSGLGSARSHAPTLAPTRSLPRPTTSTIRAIDFIRKFLDSTSDQPPVVRVLVVAMPVLLVATMVSALLFGVLTDNGNSEEANRIADNIGNALSDDGPTGGTGGATGPTGGDQSGGVLPKNIADASTIQARIRYIIKSTVDGSKKSYELTLSQDPPKRAVRVQGTVFIASGDGTVILCDVKNVCTRITGLGSMATTVAGAVAGALLSAFEPGMDIRDLDGYKEVGSRTIAGIKAGCFSFERKGKVTQCVAYDSGLTLSLSTTDAAGKTTTYEATEVAQPDPGDFIPPTEPKNLGF